MLAIYKKEISAFFSSLTGYIVIGTFLVLTGLVIWFWPDQSVIDFGFSSLDQLFFYAPMIFLLLIPAITMRSFSEEKQTGTIELLATKPVSDWAIILGKYAASMTLVALALAPTLVYFFSIWRLGSPVGNLDTGGIAGSYIGLFFLAGVFAAVGILASSLTSNPIVSFVLAVLFCLFLHWGFDVVSSLPIFYGKTDDVVQMLGIANHYNSVSRGVLDTRDLIYFLSAIGLFLAATAMSLDRRNW